MRLLATLLLAAGLAAPALGQTGAQGAAQDAAREQQSQQSGQQQQAPGLPAGAPEVQAGAPETGAGRGGGGNAPQPETSEPAQPTGGARPAEATAPQAPTPTTIIPANRPWNSRGGPTTDEMELLADQRGTVVSGRVTIPNQSAGILIQPDGRDWRTFRNQVLKWAGIIALVGVLAALAVFYFLTGPKRIQGGRSGRKVQRFTLAERVNHWMTSSAFVLLALTGLNITYGAYWLRPIIGPQAFTTITYYGQAIHHYVAFAFMAGVVVMLIQWTRLNLFNRVDIAWLKAGGPVAKGHPPAEKFNAGQKGLFWLTTLGGIAVSVSGLFIMVPGLLDNVIQNQWAHIVHGVLAFGMMAVILGHIYIGSIGMEGSFEAMRDGEVDYNWAREHHSLWIDQELERARRNVAPDNLPGRRALGAGD